MPISSLSKIVQTWSRTARQKSSVSSRRFSTCGEIPQDVRTSRAGPLPSSGYAAMAACMCPGMSISGTTVTCRSAAYATILRRSSVV